MTNVSSEELIATAATVLNPYVVGGYGGGGRRMGHVASALITTQGNLYSGVCIDTGSGTGFCAEHAAIAAMVTGREYTIQKNVAVWRDDHGALYVLPPRGRCREFIKQIDPANLDTEVVLDRTTSANLRDLLPRTDWPAPLDPH